MERPQHPLRTLRIAKKLTQGDMGQLVGLKANMIAQVECSNTDLPRRSLFRLVETFELDIEQVIDEIEIYRDQLHKYLLDKIKQ